MITSIVRSYGEGKFITLPSTIKAQSDLIYKNMIAKICPRNGTKCTQNCENICR